MFDFSSEGSRDQRERGGFGDKESNNDGERRLFSPGSGVERAASTLGFRGHLQQRRELHLRRSWPTRDVASKLITRRASKRFATPRRSLASGGVSAVERPTLKWVTIEAMDVAKSSGYIGSALSLAGLR
jgi:hypothetical protein